MKISWIIFASAQAIRAYTSMVITDERSGSMLPAVGVPVDPAKEARKRLVTP